MLCWKAPGGSNICRLSRSWLSSVPRRRHQQPAWLAHHYTEAGCAEQAIPYWQQAGQRAVDRSAHAEAIAHFTQGLALLRTLPVTPARARQELTLQCSLGVQLATRGAATPEVERTYARALELCQQVGNTQELFPVLYGLSRLYKKRGKLRRARDLGEQLLVLAQYQGDAALLLRGHYVLGDALLWLGEFPAARAHLEQGIAVYDPQQHDTHDLLYEADPWLGCLGALSVTLWFLGYPDQALQRSAEALAMAHELSHPYSLARVLGRCCLSPLVLPGVGTASGTGRGAAGPRCCPWLCRTLRQGNIPLWPGAR